MSSRNDLVFVAMEAFKDKPLTFPDSPGLTWLRVPMERVVAVLEPRIRAEAKQALREELVELWGRDSHSVRFNKAGDDLTPHQRVAKWIRTVELG